MKNELVSIIIPVYNSSTTLNKCLDSIINQTYSNLEIIIVNDGSKDDSERIIKQYDDNRIRYYYIVNHGVSYARNYGIKLAKGDYICFVDSDDFIKKNMVECLINNIHIYNVDIIRFSGYIEKSKGKYKCIEFPLDNYSIYSSKKELLNLIMNEKNSIRCYTPLLFMKNNNINMFDEHLKYLEDKLFYIQNLLNDKKVLFLNDQYYYYTNNFNSKTKNFDNFYNNLFDLIDSFDYINKAVKIYNYPTERVIVSYLILLLYRIEFFVNYNNYTKTKIICKQIYNNKKFKTFLFTKISNVSVFQKIEVFLLRKKLLLNLYILIRIKIIIKEFFK